MSRSSAVFDLRPSSVSLTPDPLFPKGRHSLKIDCRIISLYDRPVCINGNEKSMIWVVYTIEEAEDVKMRGFGMEAPS